MGPVLWRSVSWWRAGVLYPVGSVGIRRSGRNSSPQCHRLEPCFIGNCSFLLRLRGFVVLYLQETAWAGGLCTSPNGIPLHAGCVADFACAAAATVRQNREPVRSQPIYPVGAVEYLPDSDSKATSWCPSGLALMSHGTVSSGQVYLDSPYEETYPTARRQHLSFYEAAPMAFPLWTVPPMWCWCSRRPNFQPIPRAVDQGLSGPAVRTLRRPGRALPVGDRSSVSSPEYSRDGRWFYLKTGSYAACGFGSRGGSGWVPLGQNNASMGKHMNSTVTCPPAR